jgi:predicted Holliday junction resolvase-like endonuclease
MSTGAIIAIVAVVVVLLILLAIVVPRARARKAQHRLETRRQEVADAHRDAAKERAVQAEIAEGEARRARAEADLHEARAGLHERGLADEELDGSDDPAAHDQSARH